ncbi:ribonuclease ZC3H12 [Schistosoma bovis]|uniref:Ribonuclease ZC3H12 n=1 Tax=Schistosoma bovis TaxID=6184 RepID=A0A430Q267_SCHBO|nr:ribonuclease ZC3H12 [Schistosoma bovis]
MSVYVTIPYPTENLDVLFCRLENCYGVSAALSQDKLKICGTADKLNAAQDYALRFISPESVSISTITSMDCLELFSNPTIIYHFELTYNIVIIIKKSNVLIIKGCALGIKRFSRILHLLESFLKVKCAHLSDLKVSILKTLCEKYSVNYNGLQCTDAMKLALINYFISLEKPEATVISDSLLVDSAVENVHFVEAYHNESNPLSLLTNSSKIKSDKSLQPRLRPIIIDGSNVSFAHGKQKEFSVQGIRLALDYFKKRGHKDIVIVVPRHYQGKGGRYFDELEHSGMLTYTPSRTLNQERQAVYDDRVILQLAADKNAVIISNDQYRDLMSENAKFRKLIETRLLPYVMSGNTFLLPEDPYGPKGPSLSECLTISNSTKD